MRWLRAVKRRGNPQATELSQLKEELLVVATENVRLFQEIQDKTRQLETANERQLHSAGIWPTLTLALSLKGRGKRAGPDRSS